LDVTNLLLQHDDWMKDTIIEGTPTLFLNGRKLSGRHDIDDIKIMIPSLADTFEATADYIN
jgi:protein-disulfide isomerase